MPMQKMVKKANAANAVAVTATVATAVSVMVIVQNALSAQQISLPSPQSMMALLKLHQLKPSL